MCQKQQCNYIELQNLAISAKITKHKVKVCHLQHIFLSLVEICSEVHLFSLIEYLQQVRLCTYEAKLHFLQALAQNKHSSKQNVGLAYYQSKQVMVTGAIITNLMLHINLVLFTCQYAFPNCSMQDVFGVAVDIQYHQYR